MKGVIFVIIICRVSSPFGTEMVKLFMPLVPLEKQQRILCQRIKQNADNMLVGAALARLMLWRNFHVPPTAKIAYGAYGKPYLLDYPHVHFNISHSGQYVACAVCERPVGLDIQVIKPYDPDAARLVCTAEELQQIETSADSSIEFTKIWTRKEAWLKMFGCGLMKKSELFKSPPPSKVQTVRYENAFLSITCFQ